MNRFKLGVSALVMAVALAVGTVAWAGSRTATETASDAAITAKVKTQLLADSRTEGLKIDVDTQSGVVYLSGEVKSSAESRTAESLAKSVDGVAMVENNLRVKSN
jgi:osmotically-inducible protein OsmY